VTSQLCDNPVPHSDKYATLIDEALLAFQIDVMYAVQVAESARTISTKKGNAMKKYKPKH
jgi:hypothetical protein